MSKLQRRIYRALLWLHPASFRNQFGHDMVRDCEDAIRERGFAALLGDALFSLARQWKERALTGAELEPAIEGHPFLSGQYVTIDRGPSVTAFDLARASVLSALLVLTIGFAASVPNRHVIANTQSARVSHDGGIDTGGGASRTAANQVRREAPGAEPLLSATGNGVPFRGRLRLVRGSGVSGFGSRAKGGPPGGTLADVARQLVLVTIVLWLTSFFVFRSSGVGRRVVVSVLGLLGLAASVAFGAVPVQPIHAQILPAAMVQEKATPPPQDSPTTIESYSVVSVKPSAAGVNQGGQAHIGETSVEARNIPLKFFIKAAYGVQNAQIVGGPAWIDSQLFDVVAKSDQSLAADRKDWTPAQRKSFEQHGMLPLQNLLADRFALKVHFEDRETAVYALVLAKSGSKLQPPGTIKDIYGSSGSGIRGLGPGQLAGIQVTTGQLARFLDSLYASQLGRPVVDETGLTDAYDFKLEWTPDQLAGGDTASSASPSLFTAIQEQLGLKLEPQRAPVRTLVIDHVEQPSEN